MAMLAAGAVAAGVERGRLGRQRISSPRALPNSNPSDKLRLPAQKIRIVATPFASGAPPRSVARIPGVRAILSQSTLGPVTEKRILPCRAGRNRETRAQLAQAEYLCQLPTRAL
jgi:hypothetical protein